MIEIVKKINPILEKYMEENSIEVLLKKESIYLSKNNYDITKQIIDLVNKKLNIDLSNKTNKGYLLIENQCF